MEHSLELNNGEVITYLLARRQRQSVGLKINHQGLIVHAPMRVSHSMIEALIKQKSQWISKKLTDLHRHIVPPFEWRSGETLLLLGHAIALQIEDAPAKKTPHLDAGLLKLVAPIDSQALISRKVLQWYKKEALLDFSRRLEIFATQLGVANPKLLLSNARSRWGSCNSRQEIRLNWRLLQAPPHLINYVVCHELAHLKEMNHSAKFWAIVEGLCPKYKEAEKDLKAWSPKLHRI